jgi:hypothetical protein
VFKGRNDERSPFHNRAGVNFRRFRGMNREVDPGAVARDQLVYAENVRFQGNSITDRPGKSKINSGGALGGGVCIVGIGGTPPPPGGGGGTGVNDCSFDIGSPTGPRLYGALTTTSSAELHVYDPVNGTKMIHTISLPESVARGYGALEGKLLSGSSHATAVALDVFTPNVAQAQQRVLDTPGTPRIVCSLAYFQGKTYLGVIRPNAVPVASSVYSYDGVTVVEENVQTHSSGVTIGSFAPVLAVYREDLYLAYGSGGGISTAAADSKIRARQSGAWGSIAVTAPPANGLAFTCAAVYRDVLYLGAYCRTTLSDPATEQAYIVAYDGTSATIVHGPVASPSRIKSLCVYGGNLYFGLSPTSTVATEGLPSIGKFDGTTWTDSYKVITEVAGAFPGHTGMRPYGLIEYKGELFIVAAGYADSFKLLRTTSGAVAGTLTVLSTGCFAANDQYDHNAALAVV